MALSESGRKAIWGTFLGLGLFALMVLVGVVVNKKKNLEREHERGLEMNGITDNELDLIEASILKDCKTNRLTKEILKKNLETIKRRSYSNGRRIRRMDNGECVNLYNEK